MNDKLFKELYLKFIETCDPGFASDPQIVDLIKRCESALNL